MQTAEDEFEVGTKVVQVATGFRGVVLGPDDDEPPHAARQRGGYTVRVMMADGVPDYYRPDMLRPARD